MHTTSRSLLVVFFLGVLTFVTTLPLQAQLEVAGASGVVMGHVHLAARDVEAQRNFFLKMGGKAVQNGVIQLIQFPGVFVMVRQAEPTGGTVGSIVNHIGFHVRNIEESRAAWDAAGLQWEPNRGPRGGFLMAPEGVRVEIAENTSIAEPIKFHHVHFFTPDPLAIQAWYVEMFGAVAGKRGSSDAADLLGVNLTFAKDGGPVVGRKAVRSTHIGFEVKNLEQFAKTLEARGTKFDRPYVKLANSDARDCIPHRPVGDVCRADRKSGAPQVVRRTRAVGTYRSKEPCPRAGIRAKWQVRHRRNIVTPWSL